MWYINFLYNITNITLTLQHVLADVACCSENHNQHSKTPARKTRENILGDSQLIKPKDESSLYSFGINASMFGLFGRACSADDIYLRGEKHDSTSLHALYPLARVSGNDGSRYLLAHPPPDIPGN